MATWAPKTYPTKRTQPEARMACPAYPSPGAPWAWCLASRGNLAACATCPWRENAEAATVRCAG